MSARVAELGLTLQAPLPGFEDAPNRLARHLRPATADTAVAASAEAGTAPGAVGSPGSPANGDTGSPDPS